MKKLLFQFTTASRFCVLHRQCFSMKWDSILFSKDREIFSLNFSQFSLKKIRRIDHPAAVLKDFRAFDHNNSLHHNCWPFSPKWLNWEFGANLYSFENCSNIGKKAVFKWAFMSWHIYEHIYFKGRWGLSKINVTTEIYLRVLKHFEHIFNDILVTYIMWHNLYISLCHFLCWLWISYAWSSLIILSHCFSFSKYLKFSHNICSQKLLP